MPIEIISTPEAKKPLPAIILVIIIIFILAFGGSYFYFNYLSDNILKDIEQKNVQLVKTSQEKSLEDQLLKYEAKINTFGKLLSGHKDINKVFSFLEAGTHPDVWFSNFNLDSEKATLTLSGNAKSFQAVEQQYLMFKNNENLKTVTLSEAAMNKDGIVTCGFQLGLNPQIFK